jgi:hypothetical protein
MKREARKVPSDGMQKKKNQRNSTNKMPNTGENSHWLFFIISSDS